MADAVVGGEEGGLQDSAVASKHNLWLGLFATASMSGPPCQFHPLFVVLPCMVLARVAPSVWPSAFAWQVALVCLRPTL